MLVDEVLHKFRATPRVLASTHANRRTDQQILAFALVCVACLALAGCAGRPPSMPISMSDSTPTKRELRVPIPLPSPALLKPQPEPNCEYKPIEPKSSEPKATETNSALRKPNSGSNQLDNDDLSKLNYQKECYRQYEVIVRDRLQVLQASVDKTIRAIKRRDARLEHALSNNAF